VRAPTPKRIVLAAVFALSLGLGALALLDGFSSSSPVRLAQGFALVLVGLGVVGGVMMSVGLRMASWSEPETEAEFERLVEESERMARDGVAYEPEAQREDRRQDDPFRRRRAHSRSAPTSSCGR